MPHPTSLRLSDELKERLHERAAERGETSAGLAVRLIDEGLRMARHPGISFHDSGAHGRSASLAGGPDVAEVVSVLNGLDADGEDRVRETATWFGVHASRVRIALAYYADHRHEIDTQRERRDREARDLLRRHEAERALLG